MENGTTIWVDRETKEDLQKIADINGRNIIGQIRWMVREAMKDLGLEQVNQEKQSIEEPQE